MPFPEPLDALFASFFPAWNRLEARSRKDDFAAALGAATADPLWALARQWQFLELKSEDAVTPIRATFTYEVASPDEVQLGAQPYEAISTTPLEVLVEREQVDWDWRLRMRAGQQYERLTRLYDPANAASLISQARAACPIARPSDDEWIELDLASRRFVLLMEGRATDGKALLLKIQQGDAAVSAAIGALWLAWYQKLYTQSTGRMSPAWKPDRLDYEFRVRGGTPIPPGSLRARSYRNGTVDWDTFALERTEATKVFTQNASLTLTPVHVRYAGQPMRRWWEFEDSAVDFGALDVAKTDLAKLVLMEFALVFGDDWFIIPLSAAPNSLVRVNSLRVEDCFGIRTDIAPGRDLSTDALKVWQVFSLAADQRNGQSADFLYVPPSAGVREESPILEEIRFARDEGANLVFAIEHTVPNQLGEPSAGFAAHLELLRRQRLLAADTQTASGEPESTSGSNVTSPPPLLRYVLATKVPANWIPYIATDQQNVINGVPQRSVKLRRGEMVSTETGDAGRSIAPLSRLLKGDETDWIFEEAVGRAGVRVELRRQRMRSAKGETFVWLGRKVGVGKGETRSGLAFDLTK